MRVMVCLDRFGFVLPILIDMHGRVVAGWGMVLAARQMGLIEVPAVSLTDLSEAELRTLRLALNRVSDDSIWEAAELALEFSEKLLGQSPCRDPHSVSCSNGMTDAQEKRLIEALRKVDAHGDVAGSDDHGAP
jgi:hypothetical protein